MEVLEAILTRRSIRQYTNQKISDELVKKLLEAAMQAPSARNYQPWQFVVVDDRVTLNQIPAFHPYAEMMEQAALAILICGDLKLEKMVEYIVQDCSAATQNLLLAAHAMGLGAVWLGVYPRERRSSGLKNLLNIPDHIVPVSLVALGYPTESKQPEYRFNEKRVHFNYW